MIATWLAMLAILIAFCSGYLFSLPWRGSRIKPGARPKRVMGYECQCGHGLNYHNAKGHYRGTECRYKVPLLGIECSCVCYLGPEPVDAEQIVRDFTPKELP